MIFKGESDGNINKKLLIIPIIKNKEIVVTCQKSAWYTSEIYSCRIKNTFCYYENFIAKKQKLFNHGENTKSY